MLSFFHRSGPALVVVSLLVGACANILGLSSYEIDPALDDDASAGTSGAQARAGSSGSTGGRPTAQGGEANAGQAEGGNLSAGGMTGEAGDGSVGGMGGMGGEAESGCRVKADCDDSIDCTVDSCDPDGLCLHQAKSVLCEPDVGECLVCKVGIGCVAGKPTTEELLLDGNLDALEGAWEENSDTWTFNIFSINPAHSGEWSAELGPADPDATKREYADLFQPVAIPADTVKLTFSGFYQLLPGGSATDGGDYTVAAIYQVGAVAPNCTFHDWRGDDPAKLTWTAFTHDAPSDEVAKVVGQDVTMDLVAHTFDSSFNFDTLSLKATRCTE